MAPIANRLIRWLKSNSDLHFLVAGIAQLVEHNVANVEVVGSSPISRSILTHLGGYHALD